VIRVLLVDDHHVFRQPLAHLLEQEPDLTVVAQADSLAEAREALPLAGGLDVAVVDLRLPDGDGVDLVRDLRATNPRGQVLVLTGETNRTHHARAIEAGAAAVLRKTARLGEIFDAIRRLHAGESLLPPQEVIALLRLAGQRRERDHAAQLALMRLTPRERAVLAALAEGMSDEEIGQRLYISSKTVRSYMTNILTKLRVDSRLQALIFAVRHGVVSLD
jgi:DNA-binding NarL/FixJ family response regulator